MAMAEEGGFTVDGRPVELTPDETGRIRRTQWSMLLAAAGGSLAFFLIMTLFGPVETGPLFAILAVIVTPAAVSYVAFRRTAAEILRRAALRRDLG